MLTLIRADMGISRKAVIASSMTRIIHVICRGNDILIPCKAKTLNKLFEIIYYNHHNDFTHVYILKISALPYHGEGV